jgi:hypothetical protein
VKTLVLRGKQYAPEASAEHHPDNDMCRFPLQMWLVHVTYVPILPVGLPVAAGPVWKKNGQSVKLAMRLAPLCFGPPAGPAASFYSIRGSSSGCAVVLSHLLPS